MTTVAKQQQTTQKQKNLLVHEETWEGGRKRGREGEKESEGRREEERGGERQRKGRSEGGEGQYFDALMSLCRILLLCMYSSPTAICLLQ